MKRKINIPIFISDVGCKHRCSFCNQKHITGKKFILDLGAISSSIEIALSTLHASQVAEIAFFGGSFTGLEEEVMEQLLECAQKFVNRESRIEGIRFSTRPDYLSESIFKILENYTITSIELGVQSFDADVLLKNSRGYHPDSVESACRQIQSRGIKLGLQLMSGLFGATIESDFASVDRVCELKPDFMRFYPTVVIKDTELASQYMRGEYIPYTLSESILVGMYAMKQCGLNGIDIIRMGLHSSDELRSTDIVIAGPFHDAFKECVYSELYYQFLSQNFPKGCKVTIPLSLASRVIGHKKSNVLRLNNVEFNVSNALNSDRILIDRLYSFEEVLLKTKISW